MGPMTLLPVIAGIVLAILYGARFAGAPASLPKSALKTLSVACLAGAALSSSAPPWVSAGLALGALGDWCLSRPGERAFLAGMAAFGLGHLAYLALFLSAGAGWPGVAAIALFAALATSTEVWLQPGAGSLRWPVRAYVVIIALMCLTAMGLHGLWVLKLGVLMFALSDTLLASDLFALPPGPRPVLQRVIWGTYWAGQALILMGSLGLLA